MGIKTKAWTISALCYHCANCGSQQEISNEGLQDIECSHCGHEQDLFIREEDQDLNFSGLLAAFDCLIDTAERTTDLTRVYNDKKGAIVSSIGFLEIETLRNKLKEFINKG